MQTAEFTGRIDSLRFDEYNGKPFAEFVLIETTSKGVFPVEFSSFKPTVITADTNQAAAAAGVGYPTHLIAGPSLGSAQAGGVVQHESLGAMVDSLATSDPAPEPQ